MQVLVTNDDGIAAAGLHALRRALQALPDTEIAVVAPNSNQSGTARSITTRRPLTVQEVDFGDGTHGYQLDGTPVDCVRIAQLGLIPGFLPEMVVSGINHGFNLGDDITYSGTVAAALEGVVLGLPSMAVSQQSLAGEMDFRVGSEFDFTVAASFVANLVQQISAIPLASSTLLNVNVPACTPTGVAVTGLGKRIYRDQLQLESEQDGARKYIVYGAEHGYEQQAGSDFAAIMAGKITVTPIHFDLTDQAGITVLQAFDLAALLPS